MATKDEAAGKNFALEEKTTDAIKNTRKDARFDMRLYAKLESDAGTAWGMLGDISEHGLFVKCIRSFRISQKLTVTIFLPDQTSAMLNAVVRRVTELAEVHRKFGIGVEVLSSDAAYEELLGLVRKNGWKPSKGVSVGGKEISF